MVKATMADIGEGLSEIFGENITFFSFTLDASQLENPSATIKMVITKEQGEKVIAVLKKFAWKEE
jgi:hypothetical protein